jgi:hypothetical protein
LVTTHTNVTAGRAQDALPDTTSDGGVDALGYGVSNEEKTPEIEQSSAEG